MTYKHRDPARISLRRLRELQQAERNARPLPECGTVERYWIHRDRHEPADLGCLQANAEYVRAWKRRRTNRPWTLDQLEQERSMVAARTRLQEAVEAREATGWAA